MNEKEKLWINRGQYPRWLHALYAFTHGFWWLPCRLCGLPYGGHEPGDEMVMTSLGGGYSVCPNCGDKARLLNEAYMNDHVRGKIVMTPKGPRTLTPEETAQVDPAMWG